MIESREKTKQNKICQKKNAICIYTNISRNITYTKESRNIYEYFNRFREPIKCFVAYMGIFNWFPLPETVCGVMWLSEALAVRFVY